MGERGWGRGDERGGSADREGGKKEWREWEVVERESTCALPLCRREERE